MALFIRRLALCVAIVSMTGFVVSSLDAQQAAPPAQGQAAGGTTPTTPSPVSTPPARTPDQTAYSAAAGISNVDARVAALEKFRKDFPQSTLLPNADNALLSAFASTNKGEDAGKVLDRILARTPESATPEIKLSSTIAATTTLISRKVLLDRVEKLLKDAVDACGTSVTPTVGRGFEALARVYTAKGDKERAEQRYKDAVAASPGSTVAVNALVEIHKARGENAAIETLYKNQIKAATSPTVAMTPTINLADFYSKNGNLAAAETALKEVITNIKNMPPPPPPPAPAPAAGTTPPAAGTAPAAPPVRSNPAMAAIVALAEVNIKQNKLSDAEGLLKEFLALPTPSNAVLIAQAKLDEKRGNNAAALDRYMNIAINGQLRGADYDSMVALYSKTNNGSAAGLDDKLDALYREKLPNPVKPEHFTPTAARTKRMVLLELFTGSGCPPCVSSDLAFDALLERYSSTDIVPLVYHEHIPAPDPMTTTDTNNRRLYYEVNGVPTFEVDGVGTVGGGARANAPRNYNDYIKKIDKQMEVAPTAAVSVKGAVQGDSVTVSATVTELPSDAKDLRLHIILAEKELRFGGENGIRFHPFVVRGIAGEKGAGIPISATGTFNHTFNLQAIREDITKYLADDIANRRQSSPNAQYNAENRAMTSIDTSELVVVAYVQSTDRKILQATRADVTGGAAPKR